VARQCKASLEDVTTICCSPLVRARQTAAIVKPFAAEGAHLNIYQAIVSESSPQEITELLEALDDSSVLLVSHMPLVSELVGWFTDHYPGPVFPASGLACLDLFEVARGCGRLEWLQTP